MCMYICGYMLTSLQVYTATGLLRQMYLPLRDSTKSSKATPYYAFLTECREYQFYLNRIFITMQNLQSQKLHLFKFLKKIFFMYVYVSVCLCHAHRVPTQCRRGHEVPRDGVAGCPVWVFWTDFQPSTLVFLDEPFEVAQFSNSWTLSPLRGLEEIECK